MQKNRCRWIKVGKLTVWNQKIGKKWTGKQLSIVPYRNTKGKMKYVFQTQKRILADNLTMSKARKLAKARMETVCRVHAY